MLLCVRMPGKKAICFIAQSVMLSLIIGIHWIWQNPMGQSIPMEYYLPVIYNWALVANDKHDLATDLSNLACNQMGVLTTQPNVRKVAHLIIAIRDFHLKNTMSLTPNVPLKLRA
jgi:hypothetical protein